MAIIKLPEELFPSTLLRLKKVPKILYCYGDASILSGTMLGVAGPRKPSGYVQRVMQLFCDVIKNYEIVTLSGGAEGVDKMVHNVSLHMKMPTIAVLGSGITYALASRQGSFLQSIVAGGGLLLSEYACDQKPAYWTFPERNRIIAALSTCLFVPGAPEGSGSKYTIERALTCNTPIYTVPGPITEQGSSLTNHHIVRGTASAIVDFQSFIEQYGWVRCHIDKSIEKLLTSEEQRLLGLCRSLQSLEVICSETGRTIGKILSIMGKMELEGYVIQESPGYFVASKKY